MKLFDLVLVWGILYSFKIFVRVKLCIDNVFIFYIRLKNIYDNINFSMKNIITEILLF